MKAEINIDLDNAAFENGGTDELKRILKHGAERLRGRWAESGGASVPLIDLNGNKVGHFTITDD